jgi:hypothetical protein
MLRILSMGSLGTWETRKKSSAYVPRNTRATYVCGGFWLAKKPDFIKLVTKLDSETDIDTTNGVVAKWHDESHLNKWASETGCTVLDPSFCYDSSYDWLRGLPEVIRAVRKT